MRVDGFNILDHNFPKVQFLVAPILPKPMAVPALPVRRRRAPTGLMSDKPIPLRVEAEVRERALSAAAIEERTLSGFCRLVFLRGLAEYDRDPACIAPPRAG